MDGKIAFFYQDPLQKETLGSVHAEAERRGYESEFVDLRKTSYTDADVSLFVSHAPTIKKIWSKISIIMLHDLGQARHAWPNFWEIEKWHRFTAGFLPGNFWEEMYRQAHASAQRAYLPHAGVYKVGWPKSDRLFSRKPLFQAEVDALKEKLNLKFEKTVLYAPAWENGNKAADVIESLKNTPYNVLIKQLPSSNDYPTMVKNMDRARQTYEGRYDNVFFVDQHTSIMVYLAMADLLISDESSVLIEALLLEVPSIAVTDWPIPDTKPPRMPIVPFDHCMKIHKTELRATTDKVVNGELECTRTPQFNSLLEYKKHWFSELGNSSQKTMDAVETLIAQFKRGFERSTIFLGATAQSRNNTSPQLIVHPSALNYSDGSESVLLNLCSHESFKEESAWKGFRDWALLYHLSPLRKNLLNWMRFEKHPLTFLELGAGCGALTSYLVTIENAYITAVEGSVHRAQVIKQRCRNAKNLEIHACNLMQFSSSEPFDFVSLIGVLEYAGKYVDADDAFTQVLAKAFNALGDNGCLILAIENQLGHKYLAGYPEDHDGRPFEGISGYPHYSGVRTFDAASLRSMLTSVGFAAQHWFYPFPDYKMPTAILSDMAFKKEGFNYLALMELPTKDASRNVTPLFNERAYLQTLGKMGQANSFMNSFLVIAGKNRAALPGQVEHVLAAKPNVVRAPGFQTCTYFMNDASEGISVEKVGLCKVKSERSNNGVHHISQTETYHKDYSDLQDKIIDTLLLNRIDQCWECLCLWLQTLEQLSKPASAQRIERFTKFCNIHIGQVIYDPAQQQQWISGEYLDLIFSNILVSSDMRSVKTIDLEWELHFDIPLSLVYDRGLHYLGLSLRRYAQFMPTKLDARDSMPVQISNQLMAHPSSQFRDANALKLFTHWFYTVVQCGSFDVSVSLLDRPTADHASRCFAEALKLSTLGKSRQAITELSKVMLLQPNLESAYDQIGLCLLDLNDVAAAIPFFIRALELNPENRSTVLHLSEALMKNGQLSECKRCVSTLLQTNPEDADALMLYAKLMSHEGDKATAMQIYKKALTSDPTNNQALEEMAQLTGL